MFRNLRNDQRYRLGRVTLLPNGRPVKATDARLKKAMAGKTAFGKQLAHVSWLMYEYSALELLYEAGGDVPRPWAAGENAILMDYVGDGRGAAPTLHEVSLDQEHARPLFEAVMDNVALMLSYGRVHGDLSAYNILYWDGGISLIDFPQVVTSHVSGATRHPLDSTANPDAYDILGRDITRVCDYFAGCGVHADAARLHQTLWARHVGDTWQEKLAAASRWLQE
jgi:RIO kinase 1